MIIKKDEPLAPFTSFKVGGSAEILATVSRVQELEDVCKMYEDDLWVLGEGTNTLISDYGLEGLTIIVKNQGIEVEDIKITAQAGTNWDDLVKFSILHRLWGLELMSGIPGSVGAAVAGNIAAYGQAVSDTLESINVYETHACKTLIINVEELNLGYRSSNFQTTDFEHLVILSATFKLSKNKTTELEYQSAIEIAKKMGLDSSTLEQRRQVILKARENAGSLLHPKSELTAGSFYKNPLVTPELAEHVMSFEESGVTREQILKTNKLHGGNSHRVSAAHVLLAAGFTKGQTWGKVQLHPNHVLKIVNLGGAKAQDIYNVHLEITSTVKEKFGIELEPEVKFFGKF